MRRAAVIVAATLAAMLASTTAAEVHTWRWTRPTTGSPAVSYEVELRDNWGWLAVHVQVPDTFATLDQGNMITRLRARGIDPQDRRGPWSEWSDWSVPVVVGPFYGAMSVTFGVPSLTFIVAAINQLESAWPDSLGEP